MTAYNGTIYQLPPATLTGTDVIADAYMTPKNTTPVAKYFNSGYYVAGSVYEYWTSYGSPSITPPSGHTLININSITL